MIPLDVLVMIVFAILIFAIGVAFTRVGSKDGQAFFEAGGDTPWWINGLSLFISYFSAGTFVVWGSIAYKHGVVANVIQLTMAISGIIVAMFVAGKWKRTGTRTASEFIGLRFDIKTQQFYTVLVLFLSLAHTASVLYPVGKMVQLATPFSLNTCIVVIGLVVILYTAAGGLWAVLVTDVVQFIILMAAVVIVIPASLADVGGMQQFINKAPAHFFEPFNEDYTALFMLAFVGYQTYYIGGNWAYVQRYTSVSTERNAKKVAYLFAALYLISPLVWMLPPMIYRVINPSLEGLEPEGAYMMLCQRVLPAGLIGLVLSGMVSATSSKANTTINLAATVFAKDVYKNLIRPLSSDREQIFVARLFTVVFGIATIGVALLIPRLGGIVELVLSIASIAGGALFAPIIWSLYSKRITAFSVVFTTLLTLSVCLYFKLLHPVFFQVKLSRMLETSIGVFLPLLSLFAFESYYRSINRLSSSALQFESEPPVVKAITVGVKQQNAFGVKVIIIAAIVVGAGIFVLGLLAKNDLVVMVVGAVILILALLAGARISMTSGRSTVALPDATKNRKGN
ncbi:sodium:solute symporter family protein [Chryseolinea lacunae]|nr:sodium:solute symporter family protein [Chryseolinea lacunae]